MSNEEKLQKLNIIITNLWDIFPKHIQEELNEILDSSIESEELKK